MSGSLDLSNEFIQDTYPRLLQHTGSTVYDGLGNPVALNYTGSITGDIILQEHEPPLPSPATRGQLYFTSDGRLYIGI